MPSDSADLHFVMRATDTLPYNEEVHHAYVTLTHDHVERLWELMRTAKELEAQQPDFRELRLYDLRAFYRNAPEHWWDGDDPDHPSHELFVGIEEGGTGLGLPYEGSLPEAEGVSTDNEQVAVQADLLYWTAHYNDSDVVIETAGMARSQLLALRLYYADDYDRADRFGDLVRHEPEAALAALEGGIHIPGRESPLEVLPHLSKEDALPLLEHDRADIRQRAITLLGQLERSEESRGRRR